MSGRGRTGRRAGLSILSTGLSRFCPWTFDTWQRMLRLVPPFACTRFLSLEKSGLGQREFGKLIAGRGAGKEMVDHAAGCYRGTITSKGMVMKLETLADWQRVGDAEMSWRLIMADPPATFAVCRHYAGWMKMFRLFLLSRGDAACVEFLDAVDHLRLWEPHAAMTRMIYDLYVSGDREVRRKRIAVSDHLRVALAEAFVTVSPPDRADVFVPAYQEIVVLVNQGRYRQFQQMAEGIRAAAKSGGVRDEADEWDVCLAV